MTHGSPHLCHTRTDASRMLRKRFRQSAPYSSLPSHPSLMSSPRTLFPPTDTERDGQAFAALLSTTLHSQISRKPQLLRPHGFRVWGIFTAKLPADSHAARAFRKSSFFLHGTKKCISRTFPCLGWLPTNFPGSENIPDTQPWRG